MTRFPTIDMAGALRLTRQGRLKEAVAMLRGKAAAPARALDAARLFKQPAAPEPAESRFESRSFSNSAGSRTYKLFIPSGYNGQEIPLLVMLHGCTQSPDDFAAGTRMNALAEAEIFLVAYPAQARGANLTKCWNWFDPANQSRDSGEPALIAGITWQIMQDFAVRQRRVYVAGLSAGGAMAAILGAAYPELYAAIGVHSGLASGAASDLPTAIAAMKHGAARPAAGAAALPCIVFHGDRDATVNIANANQVIAQSKGQTMLRTEITEGEASGVRYTRTVFSADHQRNLLESWVLHGAGHAWSGGSAAGSFADPHGPDASREMIRFFFQLPA